MQETPFPYSAASCIPATQGPQDIDSFLASTSRVIRETWQAPHRSKMRTVPLPDGGRRRKYCTNPDWSPPSSGGGRTEGVPS